MGGELVMPEVPEAELDPVICGICGRPAGEVPYRCKRHEHIGCLMNLVDAMQKARNRNKEST